MSAADWSALLPVNVVTGFLGSGKTTLLRRLLASPRLASTAVLVNEFGEVGLDHHLLEAVSGSMVLLDNGCVCCAVRDDLRSALLDLHGRRERGEAPRYDRVVIESSGLADPAPVVHTLTADPVLRHHYRPGAVVTVVDALHGAAQLDRYPESVKQVALADRLVLTKTDLAGPERSALLRARLEAMNPAAPVRLSAGPAAGDGAGGEGEGANPDENMDPVAPAPARACGQNGRPEPTDDAVALLVEDVHRADSRQAEAERWLGPARGREAGHHAAARSDAASGAPEPVSAAAASGQPAPAPCAADGSPGPEAGSRSGTGAGAGPASAPHRHTGDVTSFCIETDEPIDWTVFGIWLGMLLHRHGENILRVKGIVDVPDLDGPVLLNAVQHTVHPPTHLPAWPRTWTGEDGRTPARGSRIVFIVRGLDRERIEHSLAAFHDSLAGEPAPPLAPAHDVPCFGAGLAGGRPARGSDLRPRS